MKYITTFGTQAAYEAVKDGLITPNVSLITENNKVEYKPYVPPIHVTSVSLNKNALNLNVGDTDTLVATVLPNDATDKSVTWSTSDSGVATVSSEGVVTAVAVGSATITVTTTDGGFTAQCATEVVDPSGGHPYVEIGGTKWATMNVGASSETEYGNYYQYGKGTAQYASTSGQSDYSGTENPLATSVDTAAQAWGGNWRMPTSAECASLTANTTYERTTINGVYGGKFTDKNDSSKYIFVPAAGYYLSGSLNYVGSYGCIWSSTPNGSGNAYHLDVYSGGEYIIDDNRLYGLSVRPVIG